MSKFVKLSEHVRPGSEVAPWLYEEILNLEAVIDVLQNNGSKNKIGRAHV